VGWPRGNGTLKRATRSRHEVHCVRTSKQRFARGYRQEPDKRNRCAFACIGKWEARHITTQAQPHTGLFTSTADASTPCCLPGASLGRWPGPVRDLKGEQGEVQGMARAVGNKGTHALRRPDIRSRLRDSLHASACRGCWAAYLRMHIPT